MKTVRCSFCITVFIMLFCFGCVSGGKATKDESQAKIEKLKAEITKLIKVGRDMDAYRQSLSREDCDAKMAEYVAAADQLREDAMGLPLNVDLRMAMYQLPICVSCEDAALESCDSLENDLRDMEE